MTDSPITLQALDMGFYGDTDRAVEACTHDADHTVSIDSWGKWDPLRQDIIHDSLQHDTARCHQCDADLEETISLHTNDEIIRAHLEDLSKQIDALSRIQQHPKMQVLKCECCGSDDVQIDAHSEFFAPLNRYELITTYDKGHYCNACDQSVSTKMEALSNHQSLNLRREVQDKVAEIEAEITRIKAWHCQNSTSKSSAS